MFSSTTYLGRCPRLPYSAPLALGRASAQNLNAYPLAHSSRLLHELQSHPIHAVAQPCRFWSIIENVPCVSVTPGAQHFGSGRAQAFINLFPHIFPLDWRQKTRPAGTGIKLLGPTKERQLTA